MPTILITGANGFVGSNMAEFMLDKGYEVRCLVRKTSDLSFLKGLNVQYMYGSFSDPEILKEALKDVEYVFHFAGKTKAKDETEYMKINADGVRTIAEACLNAPSVKKLIYSSSLAAVGPQIDENPVDENMAPHPVSIYGRSKLAGEKILTAEIGNQLPWIIIRPTGVYGPKDRDIFLYFKTISRGFRILVSGQKRRVSLIHVKDLANLCYLAAVSEISGETFMASDGGGYTWEQLSMIIERALNKTTVKITIPLWLTGFIAFFAEILGTLRGRPSTLNREKIRELKAEGWVVSIKKAEQMLGFKPEFSAEKGIAETAEWYLQNGWL